MTSVLSRPSSTGKSVRSAADFVGIGLSLLCLVHCLALPVLIAFAPVLLRNLPGDDATHRCLAVVIGFVGILAFRSGYRVHRRRWLLVLFTTGLVLVSVAAVLGEAVLTSYGEAAITVCGGLLIVSAHLLNHSFCRSCVLRDCKHPGSLSGPGETIFPVASAETDRV